MRLHGCFWDAYFMLWWWSHTKSHSRIWGVMHTCSLWYCISGFAVLIQSNQQVSVCFSWGKKEISPFLYLNSSRKKEFLSEGCQLSCWQKYICTSNSCTVWFLFTYTGSSVAMRRWCHILILKFFKTFTK